VQDRIASSIEAGDFDFEHYQDLIQEYIDESHMAKYKKHMDSFVSSHQEAIQEFLDDNRRRSICRG
jgi:hypothetical protein